MTAVAGHLSRRMLEHYRHVRMRKAHSVGQAGKRLMDGARVEAQSASQALSPQYPFLCILLILMVGATGLEPVTSCV